MKEQKVTRGMLRSLHPLIDHHWNKEKGAKGKGREKERERRGKGAKEKGKEVGRIKE